MNARFEMLTEGLADPRLAERVAADRRPVGAPRAAVLLLLSDSEAPDLLFTERSARMRDMLEAPRTRQMVAALKDNHRGLGLLFGPIASAKPARCVMCTHLAAFLNRTGAKTA